MKQWREGLRILPADEQAEAFNAIVDYALESKPYAGNNPAIKMFMALISGQIDEHKAKYSEVCEKRAKAARRRWEDANASKSMQKDANASKSSHLHTDNDNDCDCDSDNVSDKSDNKKNTAKSSIKKRAKFDIQNFLIDKNERMEEGYTEANASMSAVKRPTHKEAINYQELIEYFNTETMGVFGRIIYPISEKRKASIRARIREHGVEAFREMIQRAAKSNFLKGNNDRGWTATFDWLIKPNNFQKIIEGNYNDKTPSGGDSKNINDIWDNQ